MITGFEPFGGETRVPQKPLNIPSAPITARSPPCAFTINGNPTPSVITGNAANAFPSKIVNSAIPPQ